MNKIKIAVIPAAGYGTRFLPITKSIPKEMLPLGEKPIILHVVEEAVNSGIEKVIFVVSPYKKAIRDFFGEDENLEKALVKYAGKEGVARLKKISKMAKFEYVVQGEPYGNGGAVLWAKKYLKDQPFVVAWGDEVILTKKKPRIKQCIEVFEKFGKPVISAVKIKNPEDRCRYGMAELKAFRGGDKNVCEIVRIVEKPAKGKEPSPYATHGAYVLPYEIIKYLEKTPRGKGGELWLTDAINLMKKKTGLLAKIIEDGEYLDCGNPEEYLRSQVKYANF